MEDKIVDGVSFTQNVIRKGKLFDKIPWRNIIEAVIVLFFDITIIVNIGFVKQMELILVLVTGSILVYFFCKGIKQRSVFQILFAEFNFKKRKRKLHLRSFDYGRKENINRTSQIEGESYFEKTVFIINKTIEQFSKSKNTE